jgi:hypothetical protein
MLKQPPACPIELAGVYLHYRGGVAPGWVVIPLPAEPAVEPVMAFLLFEVSFIP